jgi:tetratricopeptide (TPR) repeat protein
MSIMKFTKTQKIITSAVVIIILLGAYIVFDRRQRSQQTAQDNNQITATTTSTNSGNLQIDVKGSGYKIEQVPITNTTTQLPDLNRPVTFNSSLYLTPEAKAADTAKIKEMQTILKKDPTNFGAWLDLGIYQKAAGDYEGSAISWKYASKIAPTSFIPLGNLGDLYAYYLNDSKLAESYYKQAIQKDPTQAYLYTQFAEVYLNVFKDTVKAKAVVAQGLTKLPNDTNLLQLQASLK